MIVDWPKGWFPSNPAPLIPENWHGSLLFDKREAFGVVYRRNRYYDPAIGRFTQEDPIGLAGGLNVYGFGAGDPVNYGDPYGLAVCYRGTRTQIRRLVRETETVINAKITTDIAGCVMGVGESADPHRREFQRLVASPHEYTIQYGTDGSSYSFGSRVISIDPDDQALRYYGYYGDRCAVGPAFASASHILAHELGHAYMHESSASLRVQMASRRGREYGAIVWENIFLSRIGKRQRCRYDDSM